MTRRDQRIPQRDINLDKYYCRNTIYIPSNKRQDSSKGCPPMKDTSLSVHFDISNTH